MASGFSVYFANQVNDRIWRGDTLTIPSSYWIALFTNATAGTYLRADNQASAQEISGTGYARVEVRGATGIVWSVSSGGLTSQDDPITFAACQTDWGSPTVRAVGVMSASSSGNVLMWADISPPKALSYPDVFQVPGGLFQCQL